MNVIAGGKRRMRAAPGTMPMKRPTLKGSYPFVEYTTPSGSEFDYRIVPGAMPPAIMWNPYSGFLKQSVVLCTAFKKVRPYFTEAKLYHAGASGCELNKPEVLIKTRV
jgi:hypothetical protein